MYFVRVSKIVSSIFPNYVWNVASHQIALTFDDGPHPQSTPLLLELLLKCDISCTHFLLGKQVELYPDTFQLIQNSQHQIGSHSYSHLNGWKTHQRKYVEDVIKGNSSIKSHLFRPPYGKILKSQWKEIHSSYPEMKCCQFNFMPGDFDEDISIEILEKRLFSVKGGDIIVLHDRPDCFAKYVNVLEYWVKNMKDRGLEFVVLQ
ncbi:MAG: polysaccharide deacetylase family protein [Chitinophagales bacterium]|nr:polysaccharide deacetylase family protein [Chitinophagales bacterium]MCZ2393336.1 polysaccharide deacetylase family protein [Chitinophagales bacterium]